MVIVFKYHYFFVANVKPNANRYRCHLMLRCSGRLACTNFKKIFGFKKPLIFKNCLEELFNFFTANFKPNLTRHRCHSQLRYSGHLANANF